MNNLTETLFLLLVLRFIYQLICILIHWHNKLINQEDPGLRVKANGVIYIDRDVFYKRKDVRKKIREMRKSEAYPKGK